MDFGFVSVWGFLLVGDGVVEAEGEGTVEVATVGTSVAVRVTSVEDVTFLEFV